MSGIRLWALIFCQALWFGMLDFNSVKPQEIYAVLMGKMEEGEEGEEGGGRGRRRGGWRGRGRKE